MKPTTNSDTLYFNGINGATGGYELPPITGAELAPLISGTATPENLNELRFRHRQNTQQHLGVKEGVDPKKLAEAGWGVIFPHDADPAIQDALGALLALRRTQAGDYFRIYAGADGYRPGESKAHFLARHGAGPGPADPTKVPYYLLLVAGPQHIPYSFQYQLDVQYAVGRIGFDTPQHYADYAQSVVCAETEPLKLARRALFFGVANPEDPATQLSTEHLVEPLLATLGEQKTDWQFDAVLRTAATKAELMQVLHNEQAPALLFTASHGMGFPPAHALQTAHQGALLCQDWPGPKEWRTAIPQDFYFAGDDLSRDANVLGLIAFCFACYGAGTPQHDEFAKQAFKERSAIAPQPFVAELPKRLLAHPRGGALAVIGHVERAWGYSFMWPGAQRQTTIFESTLRRLLEGHPVGSALDYFNERYAELATMLSTELEEIEYGKQVDPYELSSLWTANNDARSYAIIGDPAVRLPVAAPDEAPDTRAAFTRQSASIVTPTPVSAGAVVTANAMDSTVDTVDNTADLNTLTIATYAGTNAGQSNRITLKTCVTLDGDVETFLSADNLEVDERTLQLHQRMVREALTTRLDYLKLKGKENSDL